MFGIVETIWMIRSTNKRSLVCHSTGYDIVLFCGVWLGVAIGPVQALTLGLFNRLYIRLTQWTQSPPTTPSSTSSPCFHPPLYTTSPTTSFSPEISVWEVGPGRRMPCASKDNRWGRRSTVAGHQVGCDVAWYGLVWYGMVWYSMVWYLKVWLATSGQITCHRNTHPSPSVRKGIFAIFFLVLPQIYDDDLVWKDDCFDVLTAQCK